MFDQLSIEPWNVFGVELDNRIFAASTTDDIPDEGAEILVAYSGENKAVYIDGEKVLEYDDLPREYLMKQIAENTDGNLAAYGEAEAMYDRRNGERLYNKQLPEDPSDIVFSDEVETVNIQDAQDLREKLQSTTSDYVVVNIRAGIVDEEMVREYASDEFARKIIDVF